MSQDRAAPFQVALGLCLFCLSSFFFEFAAWKQILFFPSTGTNIESIMFGGASSSSKKDTQRLIIFSVATIVGIYFLFTYVIPFVQYTIEKESQRRKLLKRLEVEDAALNNENRDEVRNSKQNQNIPSHDDNRPVNKINDNKKSKTQHHSSPQAQVSCPSSSQFLPQYSTIPTSSTIPLSNDPDFKRRGLEESRKRLIEQQNKEYEEALAKERAIQEAVNERKRYRQSIIDSVKPEPDESYSKDQVVIFAFRAKSLSIKADDLNKPFKKTRRFLKSHTWDDVVTFIRSLELRPIDAPFTILANGSPNNFKVTFVSDSDNSDMELLHQQLGESEVSSNTVLWINYE